MRLLYRAESGQGCHGGSSNRWASYSANVTVPTPQRQYVALGRLPIDRQAGYQVLFDVRGIGNEMSKGEIEATLDLKVRFRAPRNADEEKFV